MKQYLVTYLTKVRKTSQTSTEGYIVASKLSSFNIKKTQFFLSNQRPDKDTGSTGNCPDKIQNFVLQETTLRVKRSTISYQ